MFASKSPGGINTALDVHNNLAEERTSLMLDEIAAEIAVARPIAVDIIGTQASASTSSRSQGVLNDLLLVCDPVNGESVIRYADFPAQYQGAVLLRSSTA